MTTYALVDGNNFFASCEAVFQPGLRGRPLVILSNNDGCIVSRSAEAKALGIPMGAPIHECRAQCRQHGVIILSSNYALYGDMSRRLRAVLMAAAPRVMPYSVDEAFLDLTGVPDATGLARRLRADLLRRLKLPCGIGIAASRTLAKFANHIAKQQGCWGGVFNLDDHDPAFITRLMSATPVGEVWGIGRGLEERLAAHGIRSVSDLRDAGPVRARQLGGLMLARTVRELAGDDCLSDMDRDEPRKQIISTRSFGRRIDDRDSLRAALTRHACKAGEKLRRDGSQAAYLQVMLKTARMPAWPGQGSPEAGSHVLVTLPMPTQDSALLATAAHQGLERLFVPGLQYRKCGVALFGLTPADAPQPDLFDHGDSPRRQQLMQALDRINQRAGEARLRLASELLGQGWQMRQEYRSPRYTTHWNELPVARC